MRAAEALELIHNQPFYCIVSDFLMPTMNGLEFCEKLRSEGIRTPFVLFTCQDEEKVIRRAFKVGVDAYLEKCPSLEVYGVLVQHIRNLVSAYRAEE